MIYAYIHSNTALNETGEEQKVTLSQYKIDKWVIDSCTLKNNKHENNIDLLLRTLVPHDILYVESFDKLAPAASNLSQLYAIIEGFVGKSIRLISVVDEFDSQSPNALETIKTLKRLSIYQENVRLEKQREGIAIGKEKGHYKGRREVKIDDFPRHYERYMHRQINKSQLAKELNISRMTLNKLISKHEEFMRVSKEKQSGGNING